MNPTDMYGSASVDQGHPLFTIAIPTFNRSALLKACVTAALAQTTVADFEVVVSNNASIDDTEAMLTEFTDSRLRVVTQSSNIGLAPNWNACLAQARGDYIVFVSDDDKVSPYLLERCSALIAKEPDLPVVVTLSDLHAGSIGRTKPALASRSLATGVVVGSDILREFFADRISVTICSVVMRTRLVRANGGLPLDMPHMSDIAVWAPLLFLGNAGFVNEACATFTYHQHSETSRLEIDELLVDGSKIVDLVRQNAAVHMQDDNDRRSIESEARSCFSRRALIALSDHRNSGASMTELWSAMWRCRREFVGLDAKAILRFVAKLACPEVIAAQLRLRQGFVPERLA
jgi:hypothetical protein